MIPRNLLKNLRQWAQKNNRKPLVIRGARQVGKTTLVKEFSKEFDAFVMLNLERADDKKLFEIADTPQKIMEVIRLTRLKANTDITQNKILLFIDEIQCEPKAIGMLRYFYEDMPQLYVIAAGSRLQELFKTGVSFPVGRVEYLSMRPCFFNEFLGGTGNTELMEMIDSNAVEQSLHEHLSKLYQTYALVGGMPEVVNQYADTKEVATLNGLYKSLLQSYDEDVEKYAATAQQVAVLRHLLRSGWGYAGQNISFARFGGSTYSSTAVHQAFELLEKAFLVSLVYPTITTKAPMQPALSRSPKLIWLDSGLVNFSAGIQVEYLSNTSLADVWRGHAAEQIVGQELWQLLDKNYADNQCYWMRDKKGATAEVDFVYQAAGKIIPIAVKCGANSHLRSMQSYMNNAEARLGIRIWPGPFSVDEVRILNEQSTYRLVNVPFYLLSQLDKIIGKYI
jgi:predicted AAA+ superfamily ATPase